MRYKPSDRGYGISRFRNLGVLFDKHANNTEFFAGYIVLSTGAASTGYQPMNLPRPASKA